MVKLWAEDMFEEGTIIEFSLKTGEIISYNRVEVEQEQEEIEQKNENQLELF